MINELSAEYLKAQELDRRIKTSAQLAQQSLYDMCMSFKEMRDSKLYKQFGYTDFGDYCEKETGFARRNVYNYISIVEKLPKDFVQTSAQIGASKMLLLTQLSDEERTQITESTDLESTTVKELKAQIDIVKKQNDILKNERDRALESNADASHQVFMADKKVLEMKNKVSELEQQIKELESRPIEVAVETDSKEVADLKDAMKRVDLEWGERYSELQEQNLKERRELMQKADKAEKDKQEQLAKLNEELKKTKAEYEKKLAEKPAADVVQDDKEIFKAYLATALDSAKRLCTFVKNHTNSNNYNLFREKSEQLAEIIKSELEEQKNG